MAISVLKAGLFTTVQDLGRQGYRKYGVTPGGAMDTAALRLANILVGNDEQAAALEMTFTGPVLHFEKPALIAITGADFTPTINGYKVPQHRPVMINKNSVLKFYSCKKGRFGYLAIAGGIQVPSVLGSQSTYTQAKIGGYEGRSLMENDMINVGTPSSLSLKIMKESKTRANPPFSATRWMIQPAINHPKEIILHVIKGPEYHLFPKDSQDCFFNSNYSITSKSNRMGYRLRGSSLTFDYEDMLSSPVTFGTIQVPPDGKPMILMADAQTTGGYPRIAHVIQADLPKLAQGRPGDEIHFKLTTLEDAHRLIFEREKMLRQLKLAIIARCQNVSD